MTRPEPRPLLSDEATMTSFTRASSLLFVRALKQSTRPVAALLPAFSCRSSLCGQFCRIQECREYPRVHPRTVISPSTPRALLMAVFSRGRCRFRDDAGYHFRLFRETTAYPGAALCPAVAPGLPRWRVRAVIQGGHNAGDTALVGGALQRRAPIGTLALFAGAIFAMDGRGSG